MVTIKLVGQLLLLPQTRRPITLRIANSIFNLESDVAENIIRTFHDVIKQLLITMSDKHRNSPVVNDNVNFCPNFLRVIVRTPLTKSYRIVLTPLRAF